MSTIIETILNNRQTLDFVDGLVERWLQDNDVPEEYKMSVPFVLLYQIQINEKERMLSVSFLVGPLLNQSLGNC